MKKTIFSLLLAAVSLFSANNSSAQSRGGFPPCTPNQNGCTGIFGAACPAALPNATVGTNYQEVVTVFIPAQVDTTLPIIGAITAPVDTALFLGVSGLPSGLNFFINNGVELLFPEPNDVNSQFTCIYIFGDPCGGSDTLTATVDFLLSVTTPFGPFQIPQSYPVTIILESNSEVLSVTSTLDFLCAQGQGSTADLTAQNTFDTYEWSTGGTTESITVNAAGTYFLTVTDNAGCTQVDSFEVKNLDAFTGGSQVTICQNQVLPLVGSGGNTFTWSPSANLTSTNTAQTVVIDLTATATYTLEVSNGICTDETTVQVIVQNCSSDCEASVPSRNCDPVPGAIGALCPPVLPTITGGVAFDQEVEFYFPGTIPLADVVTALVGAPLPGLPNINVSPTFIDIVDIGNLPAGLNWSPDQLSLNGTEDGRYYPSLANETQYGTIAICGTTCDPAATNDTMFVTVSVTAFLPDEVPLVGGTEQSFDFEFPLVYTLAYTNPLEITPSQTGVLPQGTPVTLTVDATGFTGVSWSNGATTNAITVNTAGTYTVSANDGSCTQSVSYTVQYATGIENIDMASVNIFPNPNQGNFALDFNMKKSADVNVSVYNMQGKEVYTETFAGKSGKNNHAVELNKMPQGIYMVKIQADGNAVTKRVTVF